MRSGRDHLARAVELYEPGRARLYVDLINTDPLLGPLANNGGPTQTMALLPGSPAIDAGVTVAGVTTDQRGVLRPQGFAPDIGASADRRGSRSIVLRGPPPRKRNSRPPCGLGGPPRKKRCKGAG